ncbi:MAG: DUF2007 domain-containing protein [Chloroflexi bacterium]|nr:DUF2007 domain-containing protein [Chloroflexota bacterium]
MKRVYSSQSITMVHHMMNILENNSIVCVVRNEDLFMAAGELPAIECWPELWVSDSEYDQAKGIIDTAISSETPKGTSWKCPDCGEEHEPQFTDCWKCGAIRPD